MTDDTATDSAVTDSAVTDSAVTDSAVTDSAVTDSAVTDSAVTDSTVTDSTVTDSTDTSTIASNDSTGTDPTTGDPIDEAPIVETPAPIALVESIYHEPRLDRYGYQVKKSFYLGGLYLATQVNGILSPNKLVTHRGTALMRVEPASIDPGLKFTAIETQTIYACGPLVKPDVVYDRAFLVRNALPNLWQGAELYISDNYNPTRSPPDVPTRYLALTEIAKRIGLAGVQQIRTIPYIDSVGNEVVMVIGTQIPGQIMRYYLITTIRRTDYCNGIIPTSITFIADTNNAVRAGFITEKFSDKTANDIIRVDDTTANTSYFVDLRSKDVEIGTIPTQPVYSDAVRP
jgi:hypothetical protein